MVGSAIVRQLELQGYNNIIKRTHDDLELIDQSAVRSFFLKNSIDYVVLAAAKVGGINANNSFPAEFIYENLMIQTNIIHEAFKAGIKDLIFLGSSCIYPKHAPQPLKEEYLLSGPLESTNEAYAIAKIAGIKMCEYYNIQYKTRFCSVMPTNLYGPNDNYDLENSHVLPALIRKFHLAKLAKFKDIEGIKRDEFYYGPIPEDVKKYLNIKLEKSSSKIKAQCGKSRKEPAVMLWGTGNPRREFLHVDDLAKACVFLMKISDKIYPPLINIGCGEDLTISELANLVAVVVGFKGKIIWDHKKPDGTPRKLLDISRLSSLGWKPEISLKKGIEQTYKSYLEKQQTE